MRLSLFVLALAIAPALACSAAPDDDASAESDYRQGEPERPATLPPGWEEWLRRNGPDARADRLRSAYCPGRLLEKSRIRICYDDDARVARWVSHELRAVDLAAPPERTDDFREDDALPPLYRAQNEHYARSGFQRGHLAPAGDFRDDLRSVSESFLLSNVVPQTRDSNVTMWLRLEREVRDHVKTYGRAWIFTGPLFLGPEGLPIRPFARIGQDTLGRGDPGVAVPTHMFKAVLLETKDGYRNAAGFVVLNARGDYGDDTRHYLVPVDHLEYWAQTDFFADLEDGEEALLEARVGQW